MTEEEKKKQEQQNVTTPAQTESVPLMTPSAVAAANAKLQADALATKGTYTRGVSSDLSTSHKRKDYGVNPDKTYALSKKDYDEALNNGIASMLLKNHKPESEPVDPKAEQAALQRRKSMGLLFDIARTVMGGVASKNNASIPGVDNSEAYKALDDKSKLLHDNYIEMLNNKRNRDLEYNKLLENARAKDQEGARKLYEMTRDTYKREIDDKNTDKTTLDYGAMPSAKGGKGSGSNPNSKLAGLSFGGNSGLYVPEYVKQQVRDIAYRAVNDNPQLKRNMLQAYLYDTDPTYARKSASEQSDDIDSKEKDATTQASFLEWLKTDQANRYIDAILYDNPEMFYGELGSKVQEALEGWDGYDKNKKIRQTKYYDPNYLINNPRIAAYKAGQVFTDNSGKQYVLDGQSGIPREYKDGVIWTDQWGDQWTVKNGKKVPLDITDVD